MTGLLRRRDKRAPVEVVEIDELGRMIQGVLSPELILDEFQGGPNQYDGYCYAACLAYRELVKDPYYRSMSAYPDVTVQRSPSGDHYWLRVGPFPSSTKQTLRVLDLVYGPADKPDTSYPYHQRAGGGQPGKRSQTVVERVRQRHPPTP